MRPMRLLFTMCLVPMPAFAASTTFDADTPIAITLSAPLSALARDDDAEPQWRPGTLVWQDTGGVDHRMPVELRPRGKSRRNEEACSFPPLRLDLPKQETEGTPFDGLDKVKVVTHCSRLGRAEPNAEQRLRLEYVIYRLFNRLTPESFRVRPLEITYVDTDRGDRASVHPAFLIEPDKDLARRLGAERLDTPIIDRARLDPARANLVEMFQYFVGNTDFSLVKGPGNDACCHNAVPLTLSSGQVLPVPYDFDSTGVVDPPYAAPLPQLQIKDLKQRLYRGHCRPEAVVEASLAKFRDARDDLYAIVQNDPVLSERSKSKTIGYFDDFYETIGDPKELKKKILDRCI